MTSYLADQILPDTTGKLILTAAEVAEMFRIDERTVRRLAEAFVDSGGVEGLPGFKIGKLWRFNLLQLRAYLLKRSVQ